jgi:hypothetical protein
MKTKNSKVQSLIINPNSVCHQVYTNEAVQLSSNSCSATSATVLLSLAASLNYIYFMIFLVVLMPLVQAGTCMHVSCELGYLPDGCGCYFPGQCADSWGVSRYYQTCESGGRLICQTRPSEVGLKGKCITDVNWLGVLACGGNIVRSFVPCKVIYDKLKLRQEPTKTEQAQCLANLASLPSACQLCGTLITCSQGELKPWVINEFYSAELRPSGECPGGGRYPCDPM